jgi:hypothetical protein
VQQKKKNSSSTGTASTTTASRHARRRASAEQPAPLDSLPATTSHPTSATTSHPTSHPTSATTSAAANPSLDSPTPHPAPDTAEPPAIGEAAESALELVRVYGLGLDSGAVPPALLPLVARHLAPLLCSLKLQAAAPGDAPRNTFGVRLGVEGM